MRMPQAGTNAIRVYVGDQKIRSRESAQYFIRWIDRLRDDGGNMALVAIAGRSANTFSSQFDEARKSLRRSRGCKTLAKNAINSIGIYARALASARLNGLSSGGRSV